VIITRPITVAPLSFVESNDDDDDDGGGRNIVLFRFDDTNIVFSLGGELYLIERKTRKFLSKSRCLPS
jgi:hypothetical protein